MNRPWLSVIVPSHNGDRWFAETLQSVGEQDERGIEVLVVDSSDGDTALNILDGFSGRLDIRAYRRPDLSTWTAKTNFGVKQARADHICMLHKDDAWLPGRARQVRHWLESRPDAVMHLHPAHIIDETGKRLGMWRCPLPAGDVPVPPDLLFERLLVQNFIAVPTPVIRRDAFLAVGGIDNALWYTADWDLWLKLLAVGDVYYRDTPLACFRIHGGSQTMSGSRDHADFRNQMQIVLDRHAGRLSAASRDTTLRVASTSIAVNTALAATNAGSFAELAKALLGVATLGPRGILRYLYCSRIFERAYPRLRARLASGL